MSSQMNPEIGGSKIKAPNATLYRGDYLIGLALLLISCTGTFGVFPIVVGLTSFLSVLIYRIYGSKSLELKEFLQATTIILNVVATIYILKVLLLRYSTMICSSDAEAATHNVLHRYIPLCVAAIAICHNAGVALWERNISARVKTPDMFRYTLIAIRVALILLTLTDIIFVPTMKHTPYVVTTTLVSFFRSEGLRERVFSDGPDKFFFLSSHVVYLIVASVMIIHDTRSISTTAQSQQ